MRKEFIAISLLTCFLLPLGVAAAAFESQSLISVGSGFVVVPADIAIVSLAIEHSATEGGVAQRHNQQVIDRITQALIESELPGLQWTVRQVTFWETADLRSQEKTFKASSGLDVQISDLNQVGHVVDLALQSGASTVQGVRFELSDPDNAARKALELAVEDAIHKANLMSSVAGLRVTMVREIRDSNAIRVHNPSLPQTTSTPLPPLATPIYRGQILIHAEVTVVFDVALDRTK